MSRSVTGLRDINADSVTATSISADEITAVTITGDLVGNADAATNASAAAVATTATSATDATNSTKLYLQMNNTGTQDYQVVWSNQALYPHNSDCFITPDFTFRPDTCNLSATKFTGDLVGNADTATNATTASSAGTASSASVALSDTIAPRSVALSSLESGNTIASLASHFFLWDGWNRLIWMWRSLFVDSLDKAWEATVHIIRYIVPFAVYPIAIFWIKLICNYRAECEEKEELWHPGAQAKALKAEQTKRAQHKQTLRSAVDRLM